MLTALGLVAGLLLLIFAGFLKEVAQELWRARWWLALAYFGGALLLAWWGVRV
jgi:hypothetical protein